MTAPETELPSDEHPDVDWGTGTRSVEAIPWPGGEVMVQNLSRAHNHLSDLDGACQTFYCTHNKSCRDYSKIRPLNPSARVTASSKANVRQQWKGDLKILPTLSLYVAPARICTCEMSQT